MTDLHSLLSGLAVGDAASLAVIYLAAALFSGLSGFGFSAVGALS